MQSLRSRLIIASLLWTGGLLMCMHMFSLLLVHIVPIPRGFHSVMALLGALLAMAAGFLMANRSLTPLRRLREKLTAVQVGQDKRIEGAYPSEVQPLIRSPETFYCRIRKGSSHAGQPARPNRQDCAACARFGRVLPGTGETFARAASAHGARVPPFFCLQAGPGAVEPGR